jgi:hypothetical protein
MRSFPVTLTLALVHLAIPLKSVSALDPVGKEEGPTRSVRSVSGWCNRAWLDGIFSGVLCSHPGSTTPDPSPA